MSDWSLHPRLASDSVFVASLPLSDLRLVNDARWPWLILVPRVPNAAEWLDLDGEQRQLLDAEMHAAGTMLRAHFATDRINVAALGNVVPQLHMHVVSRRVEDPAWPGPVWGFGQPKPYDDSELQRRIDLLRSHAATNGESS
ncbi:MAG: HIT family protein [Xanthomonadales bacterium]|nr:HIT family protein [Xanthomonadales bacterium]